MEWLVVGGALLLGYYFFKNQGSQIITGGTATPGNSITPAPPSVVPVVGVSPVSLPPAAGVPTSPVSMPPIYTVGPSPILGKALAPIYKPPIQRIAEGGGMRPARGAMLS